MGWNNPISQGPLGISFEGSPLHSPREPSSIWHDWVRQRAATRRTLHQTQTNGIIQRGATRSPRPDYASSNLHPFKLYSFPEQMRQHSNGNDWRRLKVRFGYVLSNNGDFYDGIVGGTDLDPNDVFDLSPSDEVYIQTEVPPADGVSFVAQATDPVAGWHEFVVPDDGFVYNFWISLSLWKPPLFDSESSYLPTGIMVGKTNIDAYSMQSGTPHLNDVWPSFPENDPYHYLIGQAGVLDGVIKVVQTQFDNIIFNKTGQDGPAAPGEIQVPNSVITSGVNVRGEWADTTLYFVGDIVTVTDKSIPMVSPYQSDMPIAYALLPNNDGMHPMTHYGPAYGAVSGVDPLSHHPEPWKQLTPSPQVYSGPLDDPNAFLGPVPFDVTKGALYYKIGATKLYSWNATAPTPNWTGLIV